MQVGRPLPPKFIFDAIVDKEIDRIFDRGIVGIDPRQCLLVKRSRALIDKGAQRKVAFGIDKAQLLWRRQLIVGIVDVGVIGREKFAERGDSIEKDDNDQTHNCQTVARKTPPHQPPRRRGIYCACGLSFNGRLGQCYGHRGFDLMWI
jgi:hypothetical protein